MSRSSSLPGTHVADVNQNTVTTNVWPSDVQAFLALVDEVVDAPDTVPTVATVLDKGRLTLVRGAIWSTASHAVRVEILRHEASHVAHGCWMRIGDRDARKWNVACDAIIHALNEADWALVDRECGIESVTLDRLAGMLKRPVSLMPSERIYDLLKAHE